MQWVHRHIVRSVAVVSAGALAFAWGRPSSAAVLSGEVFDGGTVVPVSPASSMTGTLSFAGSDSFFTVVAAAFGAPQEADPNFQANSLQITTASLPTSRTLRILITQTGLTSPATNFQVASTFNNLISSTTSATVTAFIDPSNTAFAETTPLAAMTYTSTSATQATSLVVAPHPTPFSETFEFNMVFGSGTSAGSSLSASEALTAAVPEPTSVGLVMAGLATTGLGRRRRRLA